MSRSLERGLLRQLPIGEPHEQSLVGKLEPYLHSTNESIGDEVLKELEIPEFINLYNYFMNGADRADQLRVYYK